MTAVSPTSGPLAGRSIVITGTGFAAGATATIGGTAATTTGWTATSLTVTAPAKRTTAGTYPIVVTVDGQPSTEVLNFT